MAQLGVRRKFTSSELGAGSAAVNIPDKLYFRIGEVASVCGLPAYVLRFWESEFPQLKPNKGGTGQRLYRRRDVLMALRIKKLLYEGGYTIPGARRALLVEQYKREPQMTLAIVENEGVAGTDRKSMRGLREEMRQLLEMLGGNVSAGVKKVHPLRAANSRTMPIATSHGLFE